MNHRFSVLSGSVCIGHTSLELGGDAPMGCAEGSFRPSELFKEFLENTKPLILDTPEHRIWGGLLLRTNQGQHVECHDTTLHVFSFNGSYEATALAVGIGYPLYGELFPEYVTAYGNQFKE